MRAQSAMKGLRLAGITLLSVGTARGADDEPAGSPEEAATVNRPGEAAGVDGRAAMPPPAADVQIADYLSALEAKRLGGFESLGVEQMKAIVARAESVLGLGRGDEAIAQLSALVESPRFAPLADLEEGRAARYLLGDALLRAGAYARSREHLVSLVVGGRVDSWYRRSVARIVDLGLKSGEPRRFLGDVSALPGGEAQAWAGDVAYLEGVAEERDGRPREALAAFSRVSEKSRFWAQAQYRAGLLEVEGQRLKQGEAHFCRVADPKLTPKMAPLFGGDDFFRVRDLSRLALGRVAHEAYRFDDARYYYHLVPGDSEALPEALYESATSSYEAKDYAAAHALINELKSLERHHAYEDEVWVLDAYVDLAQCQFPRADAKLREFMARYEPVLAAVRRLEGDARGLDALLSGGEEPGGSTGVPAEIGELVSGLVRLDASYGHVTRRIADLDRQLSGLRGATSELRDVGARLEDPNAVTPRAAQPIANTPLDRARRLDEHTASLRRLLRETARVAPERSAELDALKGELIQVESEAATLRTVLATAVTPSGPGTEASLAGLLGRDARQAMALEQEALSIRQRLVESQRGLSREALQRLGKRLTRLVRRARAGRIETVLGRKRAVEIEIEALSRGYLPQGAIDSLDAARYLQDDEEYWPFDGEDWEDEYLGGEGLR